MVHEIFSDDLRVGIDSLGAQLISIKDNDGLEYIWQRNPDVWAKSSPVLFPVVGRSRGGILNIGGKDYKMPIHGFIASSEMTVSEKKDNEITFFISSNDELKNVYPFDFEFYVIFALSGKKLTVTYKVINKDSKEMYFGCGGHTGFSLALTKDDKFENWDLEFEYDEPLWANDTDMKEVEISSDKKHEIQREGNVVHLKRELFDNDAMIFENLKSKVITLKNRVLGKRIVFGYADYPVIAVWTKARPCDAATYVCLEPWQSMGFRSGEGNTIEEKFDIVKLARGAEKDYSFDMEIN